MNMYSDIQPLAASAPPLQETEALSLAELFRALGDASRVRILTALLDGEHNVGELAIEADISESAVSHHLRGLRLLRLVRADKRGRAVYYALADEHVRDLLQQGLDHVRHG
jgi:DNA-binding transcriptional ArsR family regulator